MAPSPPASASAADRYFMRLALGLARRRLGQTAPNPAVGALIVDEATGELIARGSTQPGGRPHAETHVLERAGALARGKTMYVTLEPCAHHGRTPPCVDAILAAGVRRVVCAIEDPDPRVSGKGLALLRAHGVAIEVGIAAECARWMAAGHILRMTRHRPFVQLKMAVSADGRIAPGTGAPVWVTGPEARGYAHLLRARADAILVGRKTVADDDPELTCRLPGLEQRSPRRVVLDPGLQTAPTSKLALSAARVPVTLFAAAGAAAPAFPPGVSIRRVAASTTGRLDLDAVLFSLDGDGVTRVMVEGGPTIAAAFLTAGLVDEAVIARGTAPLRDAGRPLLDGGLEQFEDAAAWRRVAERAVGGDRITTFRAVGRLDGNWPGDGIGS
jgi:diaminohydroxyphosphoribosylaminopyrimidine deaminase/5-amino-6-(5-phosphoribosylamino)uracil reductase